VITVTVDDKGSSKKARRKVRRLNLAPPTSNQARNQTEDDMKPTVFAVAAVAVLIAASTADARPLGGSGCPKWACGENGTRLTGIARPALDAGRPVVNAVTLPSGETVDLR
jgi:hypothetical protein